MKSIIPILLLLPRLAHQQLVLGLYIQAMLEQTFNVSKLQPYSFQLSDDKTHLQDSDWFPYSHYQYVNCLVNCEPIPYNTDQFLKNKFYSSNVITSNLFYNILNIDIKTQYKFESTLSSSQLSKARSHKISQGCILIIEQTEKCQVTLLTSSNPLVLKTIDCVSNLGNKYCRIQAQYYATIQTKIQFQFISILTFFCETCGSDKFQDLIIQSEKMMGMMSQIRTIFHENGKETCQGSSCKICTNYDKTFCLDCPQAKFSSKDYQPCGQCQTNECNQFNTQMQLQGQMNDFRRSLQESVNSSLNSATIPPTSCSSNQYYDTNRNTCANCLPECYLCQNAFECISCIEDGFFYQKKCYLMQDLKIIEDKTCNGTLVQAGISPNDTLINFGMSTYCQPSLTRNEIKEPLINQTLNKQLQICVDKQNSFGSLKFELNCTIKMLPLFNGSQFRSINISIGTEMKNETHQVPTHLPSNSTSTSEQISDISDMSINQDHSNVNKSIDTIPSLTSNQTFTATKTQSKSSSSLFSKQNKSDTSSQKINKSKDLSQNKSQSCEPPCSSKSTISSNQTSQMSASPTQSRSDSQKLQNATISEIMQYMAQEDEKSSPTTAKINKLMNNSYQDLSNRSSIVGQVSYAMRYVPFWSLLTNYPYWLCYFQLMKLHTMYHVEATENLLSMWVFKGAKNTIVQNMLPIDADYKYNNSDLNPVYNQLGLTPIFVYSNSNVILTITLLMIFKGIMALILKTDFDPSEQTNQYLLIQELTTQQKMLISNLYEQDVSRIRLLRDRFVYSTLDQAYLCSEISLLLMIKYPGYDGAFEIISIIIAICYLFFSIGVNGKAYYRIRQIIQIINHFKFTNHQAYDLLVMKTRSVFRYQLMDLDLSSNANYYYHLLTYCKKSIMIFVVFFMNDEYGMNILFLLQVAILYALFDMRPYKKKIKQLLYTIVNITFLFVILLKLFLSLDIQRYIREPSRSALNDCRSLGWVVVCMELIGLGLTIFYTLIGMCETLRQAICKKQTQTQQPTLVLV